MDVRSAAVAVFGEPNKQKSTQKTLRFGRKGSVSVECVGAKAGLWYNFETGQGGCLDGAEPRLAAPAPKHRLTEKAGLVGDLVRRSVRAEAGDPVARYLVSRGIQLWPHSMVRRLEPGPSMLVRVTDEDDDVHAIQLTHIDLDGGKVIRGGSARHTYAARTDWSYVAAVRLPGTGVPILCEGVETGLSIWLAFGRSRKVLCCLGCSNIGHLRIGAKRIVIAADGDDPDSPAFATIADAARRHTLRGVSKVTIARPPTGKDFNDLLVGDGAAAVCEVINGARMA